MAQSLKSVSLGSVSVWLLRVPRNPVHWREAAGHLCFLSWQRKRSSQGWLLGFLVLLPHTVPFQKKKKKEFSRENWPAPKYSLFSGYFFKKGKNTQLALRVTDTTGKTQNWRHEGEGFPQPHSCLTQGRDQLSSEPTSCILTGNTVGVMRSGDALPLTPAQPILSVQLM